jgi:hypothetical protein
MPRKCTICQHVKRAEIDRRLAAGEPGNQIAKDYSVASSSLHRHRANCLKLASSNAIMKETARGTAALVLLPSKETLNGRYTGLLAQLDEVIAQARQQNSIPDTLKALGAFRQTLDSMARLAGHDRPIDTQINVAIQNNVNIDVSNLVERLIAKFDREPELKGRIAEALMEVDHDLAA